MTDTMRSRRNACEASSDDGDFGSVEGGVWWWWSRRENQVEYILDQDVYELERTVAQALQVRSQRSLVS